jgi:hypothetical protein
MVGLSPTDNDSIKSHRFKISFYYYSCTPFAVMKMVMLTLSHYGQTLQKTICFSIRLPLLTRTKSPLELFLWHKYN